MFHRTTGHHYSIWTVKYYDADNARYCWLEIASDLHVISERIGVPVTVNSGDPILPTGFVYNGAQFYQNPTASMFYLFLSPSRGVWCMSKYLGYGTRETDNGVGEDPRWSGDEWYSSSATGTDPSGTYIPRGTLKNDTYQNIIVNLAPIEGWMQDEVITPGSPAGEYSPVTGVTDRIRLGWLQLKDENENTFLESMTTFNGESVYSGDELDLTVWYDSDREQWIISTAAGVTSSDPGYWYSPYLIGEYLYDGDLEEPVPETFNISVDTYMEDPPGENARRTARVKAAQVAVWL